MTAKLVKRGARWCNADERKLPDGTAITDCEPPPSDKPSERHGRSFIAIAPNGDIIAILGLEKTGDDFKVGLATVRHATARRQKLGTRLYEEALKYACARGARVFSDVERSHFAEAFWQKQRIKGRASCERGAGKVFHTPLQTLWQDFDRGKITREQYQAAIEKLPKTPPNDAWPCRRYLVTEPCKVPSLDGLRRRGKKRRR